MKKHHLTPGGCGGMARSDVFRFNIRKVQRNIHHKETGI